MNKIKDRQIILLLLLMLSFSFYGQQYYRIKADLTVKKMNVDSTFQLVKGAFYYDDIVGKLTYQHFFPEKETYIMQDTNVYQFSGDKYLGRSFSIAQPRTSFFALLLHNNTTNYGFETTNYELSQVEEDEGLTIATWLPPKASRDKLGKILIANKDGILYGLIFYNVEEEVLSKQFFEDYSNIDGIDFPTRVTQLFYKDGTEFFQVTTYKNIIIDEKDNNDLYDYPIEQYH
jgi:hypothetical protein